MRYEGKKLLVVGGVPMLCELIAYAQANGAYVIVSDNVPSSLAKDLADEAWDISTADIPALALRCKEAGVDGLATGFNDFNIGRAAELAEATGLTFYATPQLVDVTMDKTNFNALCVSSGVPTMRRFDPAEDPREMRYPVIVKPVDSSGSRGITICRDAEQVPSALEFAMSHSYKGDVLVEEYVEGDEVGVNYFMSDGAIRCSAIHDRYLQKDGGRAARLPLAYVYPSKYTDCYMANEDAAVREMFGAAGMRNGTLFLQGCVSDGDVKFYEMGFRLNGAKQYQIIDLVHGLNPMHCLVDHTLLGAMCDSGSVDGMDPRFPRYYCTLSMLAKPGAIGQIRGVDEVKALDGFVAYTPWYAEGERIGEEALGTQKQIAGRITLEAPSLDSLAKCIDEVYSLYDVVDEDGESLILERFDTADLFR